MKAWHLVAAVVLLPAAIGIVSLAGNMISAPIRAANMAMNSATGVVGLTLDPNNVIQKYEYFHDTYAAFKTRKAQIVETKAQFLAETDSGERMRLRAELSGQRAICLRLANDYNANATKTNVSIFQGREAPRSLDPNECNG